jgi:hypothetical protein
MLVYNSKAQDEKFSLMLRTVPQTRPDTAVLINAATQVGRKENSIRPQKRASLDWPTPFGFRRDDSSEITSVPRTQNQSSTSLLKPRHIDTETLELSLPAKHTTAAQNLVVWPSIKALIPKGIIPSYVMDVETERGLLRLSGCGEGENIGDGHEGAPTPARSSSSDERQMDEVTLSTHGIWGMGQFCTQGV